VNYLRRAKNAIARVLPPEQHDGETFEQLSYEFARVLEESETATRSAVIRATVDAQRGMVRSLIQHRMDVLMDPRNRRN
jgi:hypothetical protein